MNNTDNICYIDGKEYPLSEVEKMGIDNFSISAHIHPYQSLFKYYPNTKKYIAKEKKYRNYSFEALINNTVFLQSAENFDDCFDCAVDLDWDKFLSERVNKYCGYFNVDVKSEDINDIVYALALKLFEFETEERCINELSSIKDEVQKLHIKVFVKEIFIKVSSNEQWMSAIFKTIHEEYEEFKKVLSKFKISCFSTSPYLNRMWSSAYADNNKGFCLEYEIDLSMKGGIELYNNIFPVIYSQARNDFLPLSKNCDQTLTKADLWQMYFNGLLRKSTYWKDQCEWRLILYDGLISQNPIPFFKIKKVYLGSKMPLKERKKIVNYCRKHNIEYIGLVRDANSFNLVDCKGDCFACTKTKNKTDKPMEGK